MKILITGANGQLGREIRQIAKNSPHSFIFTDIVDLSGIDTVHLDVTDIESVRAIVQKEDISVIVNCAAYTNVDKAEGDQELCELLNAKVPENMAIVMKEANGLLIHISSDYVFGGETYNTPCNEERKCTPTGVYGLTKLHGEQTILATGCNHVILRSSWMHSRYGKNFVKTILSLIASRPELNVVFDQTGTPTYAEDLANVISAILDDYASYVISCEASGVTFKAGYPKSGIYNYSNEGVCTWYDFAKMIAEYSGNTSCKIKPCHSDEFPSKVKRPSYSVLDKTKIKETFGLEIPYWTDSLRKCISKL